MRDTNNWNHSMKRAGIYFKLPTQGASWHQEHKDAEAVALRKAIDKTWKYFTKTYRKLQAEDAARGDKA